MQPEMETQATQAKHGWRDQDGFIGPANQETAPAAIRVVRFQRVPK